MGARMSTVCAAADSLQTGFTVAGFAFADAGSAGALAGDAARAAIAACGVAGERVSLFAGAAGWAGALEVLAVAGTWCASAAESESCRRNEKAKFSVRGGRAALTSLLIKDCAAALWVDGPLDEFFNASSVD